MHTVKRLREFTSQQSKGLGLFDSNARGTCLPNLMGRSAVEQGMNDFISGFKLKGSSSLELKTDLCMLWNEESNHSVHRPYYSGCYCKTKEAKNYSDDKNVIQCGGRKCLHTIRTC